jgi:hypothetical protein
VLIRRGLCLVLTMVVAAAAAAQTGSLYRWTDERGVVHFSDVPPPTGHKYTSEPLSAAPPVAVPPTAASGPPPADAATTPGASDTPAAKREGPARVVIAKHQENPLGGPRQAFTGTVRNEGGAEAREVAVSIRVVEPNQGQECVDDEIAVDPTTLPPGASGTYDVEIENPCFHGPTQTELTVIWE